MLRVCVCVREVGIVEFTSSNSFPPSMDCPSSLVALSHLLPPFSRSLPRLISIHFFSQSIFCTLSLLSLVTFSTFQSLFKSPVSLTDLRVLEPLWSPATPFLSYAVPPFHLFSSSIPITFYQVLQNLLGMHTEGFYFLSYQLDHNFLLFSGTLSSKYKQNVI